MTDELDVDYQQFMKALGARIKQFRKERGLSLRDMVVKHDYHDSQWRRFERSGAGSLNSLLKIAKAFNTSVSILLDGLGEHPTVSVAQIQKKQAATKRIRSKTEIGGEANIPQTGETGSGSETRRK